MTGSVELSVFRQRQIQTAEPRVDEVLARVESSAPVGTPGRRRVSHPDPVTGTVELDGEAIAVTPDHSFRTERGWLAAGELVPGDRVVSLTGPAGIVGAIRWDRGPDVMWNLTVEAAHTYTVGSGAWLVHNACPVGGLPKVPVERIYEANPKHGPVPYVDSRGRTVSRAPRGDCQSILDCSVSAGPNTPHRLGIEAETGLRVILRRHLRLEQVDRIIEYFHGYVPDG